MVLISRWTGGSRYEAEVPLYRGTSLVRNIPPVGPYSSSMPIHLHRRASGRALHRAGLEGFLPCPGVNWGNTSLVTDIDPRVRGPRVVGVFYCARYLCDSVLDEGCRPIDIRLPGKGDSNSHGARPVHQKHRWIRTSRLSIKNSLSLQADAGRAVHRAVPAGVLEARHVARGSLARLRP